MISMVRFVGISMNFLFLWVGSSGGWGGGRAPVTPLLSPVSVLGGGGGGENYVFRGRGNKLKESKYLKMTFKLLLELQFFA